MREQPPSGRVDSDQLDRAVDNLGNDFVSLLQRPVFGGITVLHIFLIAVGLFLLAAVAQKLGGDDKKRRRLVPKQCRTCNVKSVVSPDTRTCPKCKAALGP